MLFLSVVNPLQIYNFDYIDKVTIEPEDYITNEIKSFPFPSVYTMEKLRYHIKTRDLADAVGSCAPQGLVDQLKTRLQNKVGDISYSVRWKFWAHMMTGCKQMNATYVTSVNYAYQHLENGTECIIPYEAISRVSFSKDYNSERIQSDLWATLPMWSKSATD